MLTKKGFKIEEALFLHPNLHEINSFLICGFLLKLFWKSKARLFKET